MRVATHDGVDAADATGHLQVDVHAVVAQNDDHLSAFGPGFVHHLLHVLVLDAKGPVGHHVARVRNRGVGESLPDDGAGHAIDLANDIGLEHRVTEVIGLDVLRHKINLARKVLLDNFLHPRHAQGELPVAGHDVHAEQFAGINHILTMGPQRRARSLPGVAAVKEQRTGPASLHAFDQRRQVCKTTDLAVTLGRFLIVQVTQRMGLCRAGTHLGHLQQVLSHQMGEITFHRANAHVDAGLPEVDRFELGMAVGHVQEGHIAKFRDVVQTIGGGRRIGIGVGTQPHARHGARTQYLEKFACC